MMPCAYTCKKLRALEELLDTDAAEELLGESLEGLEEKPLEGRFEDGNARMCQKLVKGQHLVLIERERGIEFVSGLDEERRLEFGLPQDSLLEALPLPPHKTKRETPNYIRLIGFSILFALIVRILNFENLIFGVELFVGIIAAMLLERGWKQKRQMVLFRFMENEQEVYFRLSFKNRKDAMERWYEE